MNLAELFHACNLAGVRLANVGGRLELRGPSIPADVKAGAAEHKETLLTLLPPVPAPAMLRKNEESPFGAPVDLSSFFRNPTTEPDAVQVEERTAIQAESEGKVAADDLACALAEWEAIIAEPARVQGRGPFCPNAQHRLGWRSIHDAVCCATCHPPPHAELVRELVLEPEQRVAEALVRLTDVLAGEMQRLDK